MAVALHCFGTVEALWGADPGRLLWLHAAPPVRGLGLYVREVLRIHLSNRLRDLLRGHTHLGQRVLHVLGMPVELGTLRLLGSRGQAMKLCSKTVQFLRARGGWKLCRPARRCA